MSKSENEAKEQSLSVDHRLAEAYIPFQSYGKIFEPKTALMNGTLFPELYRPYRKRPDL
ncbi:MAG: spore coat associated protein CotJA [Thermoanaerobacteraceae bacterium]|nr:spore coat associated protein CotJA [Thermoanaerobacteraceae bacterium]